MALFPEVPAALVPTIAMCVAGKLGSIAFPARQSYREGIASARTARVFLLEGDCYVL